MKFVDLHVSPKLSDRLETHKVLCCAAGLGFGLIGLNIPRETEVSILEDIASEAERNGIKVAKRLDITWQEENPPPDSSLMCEGYDIIALRPQSLGQMRKAETSSADLITLPLSASWLTRLSDDVQISSLPFEIELRQLFTLSSPALKPAVEAVRLIMRMARVRGRTIVFSSGARSSFELRTPRDMMSLARFYGLESKEAKAALSNSAWQILAK